MSTERFVYLFGNGLADGHAGMRDLLGGKGAGLAEMTRLGLPVPPGLTIATTVCTHYFRQRALPHGLMDAMRAGLAQVETWAGKRFGDPENPLLVGVWETTMDYAGWHRQWPLAQTVGGRAIMVVAGEERDARSQFPDARGADEHHR